MTERKEIKQELGRQESKEKFSWIKKEIASLLAAISIWVSWIASDVAKKVEGLLIQPVYAAEINKESLKNIKTVEVKNMEEFENYVVNKLDNTKNVAIIKIDKKIFNEKYYKENIDNNFWNIKILKIWEDWKYKYFLISGTKYKETNEGFKKVMAMLDEESKRLDEESKRLDEKLKRLDEKLKRLDEESKRLDEKLSRQREQIAYYSLENDLYAIIVYVNLGENVSILKKYNWKFSKEKLEEIDKALDKIKILKIDDETFNTLIFSLKKLEEMYPNMKNLIEKIIKKLKSKERISPSMYAYSKK